MSNSIAGSVKSEKTTTCQGSMSQTHNYMQNPMMYAHPYYNYNYRTHTGCMQLPIQYNCHMNVNSNYNHISKADVGKKMLVPQFATTTTAKFHGSSKDDSRRIRFATLPPLPSTPNIDNKNSIDNINMKKRKIIKKVESKTDSLLSALLNSSCCDINIPIHSNINKMTKSEPGIKTSESNLKQTEIGNKQIPITNRNKKDKIKQENENGDKQMKKRKNNTYTSININSFDCNQKQEKTGNVNMTNRHANGVESCNC